MLSVSFCSVEAGSESILTNLSFNFIINSPWWSRHYWTAVTSAQSQELVHGCLSTNSAKLHASAHN